jgi:disulfide bond formation protein DsbB
MPTTTFMRASAHLQAESPVIPLIDSPLLLGIVMVLVILLLVAAISALIILLVTGISRFFDRHMPSSAALLAFQANEAARLAASRTKTKMDKAQDLNDADMDDEEIDDASLSRGDDRLARVSRYIALLAAWIATCGSLFMSEALGWVPCLLCWYQRILMYPLALILAVGILRRDKRLHQYALVLSIPGACVSLYHYLYQKTDVFRGMVPCTVGVPCSADYLNWFGGVVTIPFLALIAFLIITFCMVASRLGAVDEIDDTQKPAQQQRVIAALPVFAIIAVVVLAFLIAGISVKNAAASAPTVTTPTHPLPTADAAALAHGKVLYEESCAACHGLKGEGTPAGLALTTSQLVRTGSDQDLAKFVRMGRSAQDPHNITKLAMPASGGRTDISDADLAAVIGYMRQLVKGSSTP